MNHEVELSMATANSLRSNDDLERGKDNLAPSRYAKDCPSGLITPTNPIT
jgi:hypothetical protein